MDCTGFTSLDGIKSILRTDYGLEIIKISKMDSYFNINYLVSCLLEASEIKFVVKIVRVKATSFFDNSELQHVLMLHLSKNGFRCSEPLRTKGGDSFVTSDAGFLLQVLTFLPGISVNCAKLDEDSFLKICYLTGQNLANLHLIGQNLGYKFESKNPRFRFLPENALKCRTYISSVSDAKIAEDIQKWMKLYEKNFLPELTNLRQGFIHGDFSDCNVIVTTTGEEWQFGGIIDFEHCHYGYLVGDLGICMAYFLMKAVSVGCDVTVAAATLLRGYQSRNLLTDVEKLVLLDAIMSRVCVSYITGCHEASLHPENGAFIFSQSKYVPKLLEQFGKIERTKIQESLF